MSIRFQPLQSDEGFSVVLSGNCPDTIANGEYYGRGAVEDAIRLVARGTAEKFAAPVQNALARYAAAVAHRGDAERRAHELERSMREAPHVQFGPKLTATLTELRDELRAVRLLHERAEQEAEDAVATLNELQAQVSLAVRNAVTAAIGKRRTAAERTRNTSEAVLRASLEMQLSAFLQSAGELSALDDTNTVELAAAVLAETHAAAFGPTGLAPAVEGPEPKTDADESARRDRERWRRMPTLTRWPDDGLDD